MIFKRVSLFCPLNRVAIFSLTHMLLLCSEKILNQAAKLRQTWLIECARDLPENPIIALKQISRILSILPPNPTVYPNSNASGYVSLWLDLACFSFSLSLLVIPALSAN